MKTIYPFLLITLILGFIGSVLIIQGSYGPKSDDLQINLLTFGLGVLYQIF